MITANRENLLLQADSSAKERFWAKINASKEGCWGWNGSTDKDGYGLFTLGGKALRAHRLAFALACGEIPSGMVIRHSCHNPNCCNPDHLSIGTQQDNIRDMIEAGRQFSELRNKPKSSAHTQKIGASVKAYRARLKAEGKPHSGRRKLTDDQVRQLRSRYSAGSKLIDLSREFGLCKTAVARIAKGKTYSHV